MEGMGVEGLLSESIKIDKIRDGAKSTNNGSE